jgi:hypothetical protein
MYSGPRLNRNMLQGLSVLVRLLLLVTVAYIVSIVSGFPSSAAFRHQQHMIMALCASILRCWVAVA